MKTRVIIVGVVCLLLIALPIVAQNTTRANRVNVPFDFWVADTHLPAGDYMLQTDAAQGLLVMRNVETGEIVHQRCRIAARILPTTKSELMVLQAGDRNVLHQIWTLGNTHGLDLLHEEAVAELPNYHETRLQVD